MSGGGNKVKDQTYSTGGLYGSSTTGKRGTTYKPSDFESQLVQQTTSAIPSYLSQLINPTYDSQSYLNRQQQLNNTARQSLENNVINPLAQRGLTRGSSINQMSNQLNNKLTDAQLDLMNSEDSRVSNILSQLMGYYQVPYNMMSGINQASGNLYQQAVQQAAQQGDGFGNIAGALGSIAGGLGGTGENAFNPSDWKSWAKLGANAAGTYFGGPIGGAAASAGTNALL